MVDIDATDLFLVIVDHPALFYLVDVNHCLFLLVDVDHPAYFYLVDGRRCRRPFNSPFHHAQ